jgi:hypothetical protein
MRRTSAGEEARAARAGFCSAIPLISGAWIRRPYAPWRSLPEYGAPGVRKLRLPRLLARRAPLRQIELGLAVGRGTRIIEWKIYVAVQSDNAFGDFSGLFEPFGVSALLGEDRHCRHECQEGDSDGTHGYLALAFWAKSRSSLGVMRSITLRHSGAPQEQDVWSPTYSKL